MVVCLKHSRHDLLHNKAGLLLRDSFLLDYLIEQLPASAELDNYLVVILVLVELL